MYNSTVSAAASFCSNRYCLRISITRTHVTQSSHTNKGVASANLKHVSITPDSLHLALKPLTNLTINHIIRRHISVIPKAKPSWGSQGSFPCWWYTGHFAIMSTNSSRPPISVTYSATPTLLRHLPFILNSLNTQLPLRNLHWKTSSRPTIRTIQECDLRFIGLIDAQSKGDVSNWIAPSEVEYGSLFTQSPMIHVAFVECEVGRDDPL